MGMMAFIRNNPRFLRYWISTWCSELGDWVRNMALLMTIMTFSNESAVAVSIGMFCEFAPMFLLGPLVGVLADRWPKKRTMLIAILLRILVMLLYIFAISMESLLMMYVCAFLSAVCTSFFRAPTGAFLMQFLSQEDRPTAISLRQMSISCMLLIGPALGTTLYVWIGGGGAILLTVALLGLAAVLLASIQVQEAPVDGEGNKRSDAGIWAEMRAGFGYCWNHAVVRPILMTSVFLGVGSGLIDVLEIFVLTDFLGMPKELLALFASVQGTGMLISSVLMPRIKLPSDRLIVYGMVVQGIGIGGMVAYQSLYVTLGGLLLFSLGNIAFNLGNATLLQTRVEYEYQGRTGTTVQMVYMFFMVCGLLSAGWLAELFTVRPVFLIGGLSMILAGALAFMMYRRQPLAVTNG